MSQDLLVPPRRQRIVEYPDSDGEPMAETGPHVLQITYLHHALRWWLRAERLAAVGANMLLYYREGHPKKRIAPDVYELIVDPDQALEERERFKAIAAEAEARAHALEVENARLLAELEKLRGKTGVNSSSQ
jgi:hypothetical protein